MQVHVVTDAESFDQKADSLASCRLFDGWSDDIFGDSRQMCEELVRELEYITDLFFWDDKCVSEGIWVDRQKCVEFVILIDGIRWDFTVDDTSEEGRHSIVINRVVHVCQRLSTRRVHRYYQIALGRLYDNHQWR